MLKQEDRIFKNLYNDLGSSLNDSFKRDDWSNTKELISKGKVRFNKSEIRNEPCAIYYVESGDLSLLIENCEDQALVEFK